MDRQPDVPEVWGGLECTIARIGERYRNQLAETGHTGRPDDLDAIAATGIKTLRYPVLWEMTAPDHPDSCDWSWHDERLGRLRRLGIAPIAGLVHHGSGPRYTNLLDPAFPELLARHAERTARRYPWITMFTPVNEPLTTARFSGLYGHWYPHCQDLGKMLRMVIIQCRAIVLSMRAIRRVTPSARLVQTEDLGKAFSTPELRRQADYENERRWLSLDLLCGRITRGHPWYREFLKSGISARDLAFFAEEGCAPDLIGINHYLTSERFLDQRLHRFPEFCTNGDAQPRYADVQAVRVELPPGSTGPLHRLREAWDRYRLPLAVTEVHHGGPREEQLRWLKEVWDAARTLRQEGADMRAVTVWSVLGCVDWNTLLLQGNGCYESGLFDVRSTPPRPTALAKASSALAKSGDFDHPVLDRPGWWRRDDRFLHEPSPDREPEQRIAAARRLLITGGTGTLGGAFARICHLRGLDHDLLTRADMDIADPVSVEAVLASRRPWAVINAAGYVRVADAEREAERCFRENTHGAEVLARACARRGIPYVTFSSDLVFDGSLGRAYIESDRVSPVCAYGLSKADAERRVAEAWPRALIVRTSAFFGPWDRYNFVHLVLRDLAQGKQVEASDQLLVSPTYVPDLVHATLDLLLDDVSGVWHLANRGEISWHDLALNVAREAGVDAASLVRAGGGRRGITALSSERGLILPPLDNAIRRFMRDCSVAWQRQVAA
ncbi:MAG TPA: sugar nucleotide-binding protein [Paucimonas sp.]|nr:sugar nucleotide-binding protein [Paucimonas sp.]